MGQFVRHTIGTSIQGGEGERCDGDDVTCLTK